jgi:hypothetical protein
MFSDDLVDRLAERRRSIAVAEAECLAMVAELIRREAHLDLGFRSLTALLIDRLGVSPVMARGMIGLATALEEMPCTLAALEVGSIDVPRARALVAAREVASSVFADHEPALVDTIAGLAMTDVTRALAYWSQQAAPEEADRNAAATYDRRRLFVSVVGDMVHLDGRLDPVSGQVVITALESLTDPGNLDVAETRTPAQRRTDALVGMCRPSTLATSAAADRAPSRLVHLSLTPWRAAPAAPASWMPPGSSRRKQPGSWRAMPR